MRTLGIISVAVALMFAAAGVASAQTAKAVGPTKLVTNFEDAAIWKSENQSPFAVATEQVSEGKGSLKVTYTTKPQWSNIYTYDVPLKDWSGFRYLNFDVYLEGKMPREFGMWVRDKALHKSEFTWPIGPGWNTLTLDLDELQKTAGLDRANIIGMCLYKGGNEPEVVCHLDHMYLSNAKPTPPVIPPVRMPDAELITDGGFELLKAPDEFGSPFAWWTARRWQGASFLSRGVKAVYAGASSAMIDGRGGCKIGWYSPEMEVKSPTRLKLTFYVQADDLKKGLWGQTGSITVTDIGERGLDGASVKIPEGTYAWKKVELVFDVPPKCPYVKVFIQGYGPGRVWVDDVSLRGVALDTPLGEKVTDTGRALAVDPPVVTETPLILAKKQAALAAAKRLEAAVDEARNKGLETLYAQIPLKLAELAFDVRWDIPEHLPLRSEYCDEVLRACTEAEGKLRAVIAGAAPDLKVPPHPDFAKLKLKGRYFCEGDEPKILFSMQYHRGGQLTRWFCPEGYQGSMSAVGASRYNYQQTPLWPVYQADADTRRVFDDGWCGHIIKDKYSAGGSGRCVISLDSPRMRQAIAESMAKVYLPQVKRMDPPPLYINMGFEYSYVNYDKFSGALFRKWLKDKYGTIAKLNATWKVKLADFDAVTMPSYDFRTPETNPAKYYDWGEFNLWRFTDYMKWAKSEMRKLLPGVLTTTGGGSPFGSGYWRQGIDEEGLMREGVTDIWLSETGSRAIGVTSVMDLQRALTKEPRLILDPEYHALPNTCFLMFLHGCGVMDYWWWPPTLPGEFYDSSMKHSHRRSLPEVAAVLKTALDVRRLPKYIAPFPDAKADIAMLYPEATIIQKHPGAEGEKTPYTFEIERSYGAAVRLDTPVGFASSRMILEGRLDEFKILVVPGARHVKGDVWEKIKAWTQAGGTLVITPTSLVADEYNRRREYLREIGIEITGEEVPEYLAGEAKRGIDQSGELDFIQGPVAKTIVKTQPTRSLVLDGRLARAEGTIQTVKASPEWKTEGVYIDNAQPALLARAFGTGRIYYMTGQLDIPSRKTFFDRLMTDLNFDRPVRAKTPAGGYPSGVESRTVPFEGAYLTYLHNETGDSQVVMLQAPGRTITDIFCLNGEMKVPSPVMTLAPYQTRIMRVTLR